MPGLDLAIPDVDSTPLGADSFLVRLPPSLRLLFDTRVGKFARLAAPIVEIVARARMRCTLVSETVRNWSGGRRQTR
jgi:hypothetical protein